MTRARGRTSLRAIRSQRKLLLFCTFALLTWFTVTARATAVTFFSAAQQASPSPEHHSGQNSLGQQLVKETREAAGEDQAEQFKHSSSVVWVAKVTGLDLEHAYILCVILNFVVIAIAIFWMSKKYLPGLFRNRTASIQKAMEEARKASEDANRRLAEIESRLSKLDTEIAGMRAQAEEEAVAEEQRIKVAADEDARKIVESAQQEIAAAAKSARRELKEYAANLAVSLAQKQIHVDAPTDHALLSYFAQQLSANDGEKRKGGQ